MTKQNFDKAVEELKKELGEHLVGTIDTAVESDGQFGFATDEPDAGPDARGKWCDTFDKVLAKHKLDRLVYMPFPVQGKLVYVIAGMGRLTDGPAKGKPGARARTRRAI